MKSFLLPTFFVLFVTLSFGQNRTQFSKQEILNDLQYLYTSLQDTHYNLYLYTTKTAFDQNYQSVKNSIQNDSLSLLETTNALQRVIVAANNGHTEIEFPAQSYRRYGDNGGTVFPLEIAFENGSYFVRKNWSDEQKIEVGSKILSINGRSMEAILAKIYPQVSAERLYFKHAKIEVYSFPRYYWQVFGEETEFTVEIASKNNRQTYTLNSINLIEDFEMKRKEVLNASMQLSFYRRTAYLNPGDFGGDEPAYQQFIDDAFAQIQLENVSNLIIDLRNNGGGNDSFSDYLVSYIADKPFRWTSKYEVKSSAILKKHIRASKNSNSEFSRAILSHKNGDVFEYTFKEQQPQPKDKRFKGMVFVLVNRQSHSQATVTAAQIQDYKFGVIIGEETGEYSSLCASQLKYKLPNTNIEVKVSKGFMRRINGTVSKKGVQPDVVIQDHLVDEKDEILTDVLGIIRQLN
ncbi:MAG: S41 family peptidase [Bacteroidota bacterium]